MTIIGYKLFEHMRNNKLDRFTEIIEQNPGYDLNAYVHGMSLLHRALSLDRLGFIYVLVNHGADIHLSDHGDTLRKATYQCATCYISILGSYNDESQLLKILQKYQKLITYLLESGANCNSRGDYGDTSLTVICRWTQPKIKQPIMKQIVMQLLDYGADRNLERDDGVTAERAAREQHNYEIADCIRDYQPVPTKGVQE